MSKLAFLISQISGSQRKAAICVGCQSTRGEEAQSVTEQWILGEVPGHEIKVVRLRELNTDGKGCLFVCLFVCLLHKDGCGYTLGI